VPRLRKALALSASDCLLIIQATLWFAVVELGLRLLQLRTVFAILHEEKRSARKSLSQPVGVAADIPEHVGYCVELASRLHPLHPTCLKKALVFYALLTRRGFDVQLLIGAAKAITNTEGKLDAHAWLEYQGRVILGGPGRERYSILCALKGSTVARGSAGSATHCMN
jgi:Transglutaminase-like superfamily